MIRTTLETDGVLVATIDMPGKTMNVFSADLMDALDGLMDRVEQDDAIRSCVITSAKPSFLAGADLTMVQGFCDAGRSADHDAMFDLCGRLGRQFVRLEASPKPWVAAVNGIALGGGLELALACRVRVVADDPRVQLGVPEVRWGLLPGAGGTQRLPRLAGFDVAMDLLLTGRSIDPATAVRDGIFAAAVPAGSLLDDARSIARALHGKAYDVHEKYARLAQADVPPHSDETARAIAMSHGIDAETFDRFPAYSAIIDCVLKGARLPLAQATAVEMEQFLRLMFDPVAGCMVRTLFLERLRAERELAAPVGIKLKRMAVGHISPLRASWAEGFERLKKLPQVSDRTLPDDSVELVDQQGGRHRAALRVLGDSQAPDSGAWLLLAPPGPYGRVCEIVGAGDGHIHALSALIGQLRALPWRTPGPGAVLPQLAGQSLDQQAVTAGAVIAGPGAVDPAFLDVAACLAGVSPAWSGGPLTWAARGQSSVK